MALRRVPGKPLSQRAPIAYGPRGKEQSKTRENAGCVSVSPVSVKWARPLLHA
jgi:hypothetical protein